jgi:hypothetical protein
MVTPVNPEIWECKIIFPLVNHEEFIEFIRKSRYTPFEFMISLIQFYGSKRYVYLFEMVHSLLAAEKGDGIKTFIVPNCGEHTLLTFFVTRINFHDKIKQKLWLLLQKGCRWDQVVQGKTALSLLLTYNNREILEWCFRNGVNQQQYEQVKTQYFTELLELSLPGTILQEIPFYDLVRVLVK